MKTLFRILGTAAAVAVTGAAIVALDKILNQKDPLHVEKVEFPEEAEQDAAEAEKTAEAYAEAEAKAADDAAEQPAAPPATAPAADAAAAPAEQPAEMTETTDPAAPADDDKAADSSEDFWAKDESQLKLDPPPADMKPDEPDYAAYQGVKFSE